MGVQDRQKDIHKYHRYLRHFHSVHAYTVRERKDQAQERAQVVRHWEIKQIKSTRRIAVESARARAAIGTIDFRVVRHAEHISTWATFPINKCRTARCVSSSKQSHARIHIARSQIIKHQISSRENDNVPRFSNSRRWNIYILQSSSTCYASAVNRFGEDHIVHGIPSILQSHRHIVITAGPQQTNVERLQVWIEVECDVAIASSTRACNGRITECNVLRGAIAKVSSAISSVSNDECRVSRDCSLASEDCDRRAEEFARSEFGEILRDARGGTWYREEIT